MADSIGRSPNGTTSRSKESGERNLEVAPPSAGTIGPDPAAHGSRSQSAIPPVDQDRLSFLNGLQEQAKDAVRKLTRQPVAEVTESTPLVGPTDGVNHRSANAGTLLAEQPYAPLEQSDRRARPRTMPQRTRKGSYANALSFLVCVVVPVLAVAVYYFGFASDQYVVGFEVSVRDSKSASNSQPGSGIQDLLGGSSSPNSSENYIVERYLNSRQVITDLAARVDVIKMYSDPTVDWLSRFDSRLPIERFLPFWRRMTSAKYDQVTGVSTAEVRAFSPEDAYLIATTLLALSEELVNKVINKPLLDAVRFAEEDVRAAEKRLKTIREQLTQYRNTEQLIDPQSSAVASNVSLVQAMRASLNQMETELATLRKQQINRDAVVVVALETRIKATKEQLAALESQVGTVSNGGKSLSAIVGRYEQLDLERQFAQSMVLMTMQALDQARSRLLSHHIYVTPFVHPALPQASTYPRRYTVVAVTAFFALLFWIVGLLVVRSVREHLS